MKLSIFILAAGHGERLRPITNRIPKPLLPILGKPVLQTVLERVSKLPINKIGINLHHYKEVIKNWIVQSEFSNKTKLFPEEPILGTGGALKNAEAFLQNRSFLVYNADVLSDIDLEKLVSFHFSSDNLITLAVHDYPEFNSLAVDEKGFLLGVGKKNILPSQSVRWLAFTGIAVYSSAFLTFIPSSSSSVIDAWLKALSAGYKIGTFDVTGCFWSDIGTPSSYARGVINTLKRFGEMVFIHPSSSGCQDAKIDGYVIIEKACSINKGVFLRNCVVLPGTAVNHSITLSAGQTGPSSKEGKGMVFENCILGPGFKIDLYESELFGSTEIPGALHIGTGGSDRKYYRVIKDDSSEVLMQCTAEDPDFQRHIEYTKFFKEHAVPVPELREVKPYSMSAYFEDLCDLSLYSWLKCKRDREQVEHIYKQVLDMLSSIHTGATEHVAECPILQSRIFDYEHLRWETSYFIEKFVGGFRNITVRNRSALNNDFHRLALEVDSFPKTVVHRDFQSQNIMITKGNIPRLLDYQGARMGPPAYDLVSILWDPYYRLDDTIRQNLLDYYIMIMTNPPQSPFTKGGLRGITDKEFKKTLLPCRLQRHMQALGAYGFLSLKKGKSYFLKYVPEGLRLLKESSALSQDSYPALHDIVMTL